MDQSLPTIHALLIGIDYYQPNRLYRSLRGSVRDITLVETFLRETLRVPAERIRKLISPNPEDPIYSTVPVGVEQAPTYENIVKAFNEITQAAQFGDQVYIHYCGHGGRVKTMFQTVKKGIFEQYDEGLAPMDIGDSPEGRYLRDVEMTTLLKRMTEKGLLVTVVLDCCNSGGINRDDYQIRGGEAPDTIDRSTESLVADREELERNAMQFSRDRPIDSKFGQVRDYVLLAACRPNEYAYEYAVNQGSGRYGALTYWMIDTLSSMATRGQPLTYKVLHDRVSAQIQSKFKQQTPMILGESERLVFGSDRWSTPFTLLVIKVDATGSQVKLNGGSAQGLSEGTRFSIYPVNTTNFSHQAQQVAIVELTQLDAVESMAKVLTPAEGGIAINGTIELGAPAIMVSPPVELIGKVRFLAEKTAGQQEQELPAHLVPQQVPAVEAVRQALAENGWIVEAQAGEAAHYQVAVGREGEYEISMGSPIPNLRPLLPIDQPKSAQQVVKRLVHLVKYQAVQSLDNAGSSLAESIEMEILKADATAFDQPQNPVVKEGEIITLRLTNRGTQPLKVVALDLEPTWEISQIPLGGMESPFFNLEAGAIEDICLRLAVPPDALYNQSKETLKIFAVQQGLVDFRWLTLPPLDQPYAHRGANPIATFNNQITRGSSEGINPLNNLLAAIGADLDRAPIVMRAATVVVDPNQEWVTKQIQIVVERS